MSGFCGFKPSNTARVAHNSVDSPLPDMVRSDEDRCAFVVLSCFGDDGVFCGGSAAVVVLRGGQQLCFLSFSSVAGLTGRL